jgi:hypothetical protein
MADSGWWIDDFRRAKPSKLLAGRGKFAHLSGTEFAHLGKKSGIQADV